MAFYKYKGTLAELFPNIAKDWHPTKNGAKTPNNITPGVGYKAWWLCDKGHEWSVSVSTRVNQKTGCPYCGNKKLLKGYNDLLTVQPDIAKDWHPTKNGDKTPSDVLWGTHTYYWWQCVKGHEWRQKPSVRCLMNTGCPKCAESLKTSFNEQALLYYMKKVYDKVEGNYTLNGIEVDVYIKDYNIAIEYDGVYYHKDKVDKDRLKNKVLKDVWFIRVREEGLPKIEDYGCYNIVTKWDVDAINKTIENLIILLNSKGFIGNKVKVDIDKDRVAIQNQISYKDKKNSLGELCTDIAQDWHPTKNGVLTPYNISCFSNKKVWWLCHKCNYEWEDTVHYRVTKNPNCSMCKKGIPRQIIHRKPRKRLDTLDVVLPNIAKEWHPTKNGNIVPSDIKAGSSLPVWWLCDKGHSWVATPSHRGRGDNCPYCSSRKLLKGFNDLATVRPDIASEWHPTKNGVVTPSDITYKKAIKVWWRCSNGHEWVGNLNKRVTRGDGCPHCRKEGLGKYANITRAIEGVSDLATMYPKLLEEWDYDKNYPITPNKIHSGSDTKVWWVCSKGHSYETTIYRRTKQKCGCPYCSNQKVLEGYNDLATVRPDVAKDWDYIKNYPLKPTDISKANTKKVWWVCSNCGEGFVNSTHNRCRNKSLYCIDCTRKLKCK